MPSQARKAANARYIAKLDQIKIQPVKAEGEAIRAAASAAGMSLQAYILEAIRDKMKRE
jgi:predicted DNA binding CopG/RHH family protein